MRRVIPATIWPVTAALLVCALVTAEQSAPERTLTREDVEQFLRIAKMGPRKEISIGVAATEWALMDDGRIQHRGHIATIDVTKGVYTTGSRTELNFRDSWKFNVAAYELAKLLDFSLVPPSVERNVGNRPAAVTWWIDDAMMERERIDKKLQPSNVDHWNLQMNAVRVFNELIYNVDANLTNLLITKDWNLWMIDHTRAFRLAKTLDNPSRLVKSDRKVLAKLRELSKPVLTTRLRRWLSSGEIDGLLARRDRIVEFFDKEIAAKGEGAVLFDLPPRTY